MLNPYTRATPVHAPPKSPSLREQESVTALLRRLMNELLTLFRHEMALATAEVSETLTKLAVGVASVAAGGAVLYAGFLTLLAAAVLALATIMTAWLAALIVGGGITVIGVVLLYVGKRSLHPDHLKPERSVQSLREDKDVLLRKTA